jgi:hypothetical protein
MQISGIVKGQELKLIPPGVQASMSVLYLKILFEFSGEWAGRGKRKKPTIPGRDDLAVER